MRKILYLIALAVHFAALVIFVAICFLNPQAPSLAGLITTSILIGIVFVFHTWYVADTVFMHD